MLSVECHVNIIAPQSLFCSTISHENYRNSVDKIMEINEFHLSWCVLQIYIGKSFKLHVLYG